MLDVLNVILKLIGLVPHGISESCVSVLYWMTFPFTGRERRVIYFHAKHVLRLEPSMISAFCKRVLCSQVNIYWDTLRFVLRPSSLKIEGMEEFQSQFKELRSSPQGHVIITAHLGAWELAGHFCALATGRGFNVLAKPSKSKGIDPFLNSLRQRLGMSVLWTDSKSLYRDMLKLIEKGEGVGFVMDQRPAIKGGGDLVPFLGVEKTPIVTGPAAIAGKKNLPIVGCYCVRVARGTYRVIATNPFLRGHGETDSAVISMKLASDMEQLILKYPEQWAWNYRRWKYHDLESKFFV